MAKYDNILQAIGRTPLIRLRRIGAALLLVVGLVGVCLAVRYFGLRAGWWPTLLPMDQARALAHSVSSTAHAVLQHVLTWFNR